MPIKRTTLIKNMCKGRLRPIINGDIKSLIRNSFQFWMKGICDWMFKPLSKWQIIADYERNSDPKRFPESLPPLEGEHATLANSRPIFSCQNCQQPRSGRLFFRNNSANRIAEISVRPRPTRWVWNWKMKHRKIESQLKQRTSTGASLHKLFFV